MTRRSFVSVASIAAALAVAAPSRAQAPGAPGTAVASPGAGTARKLTKSPRLAHFVEAPYPEVEKAAARAASVVLQIGIGPTGAVEQVAVTESAGPAFDAAALEAVRQFVFEPAEIDGKPASIRILYRYEFVLRAEAPTTATFTGQVRDRRNKQPLAAVSVSVEDGVASATTDADGRFRIDDVAPGPHAISLSGPRLTALQTSETFEAGHQLAATYDVEPQDAKAPAEDQDDLEVVVTPPPIEKQVVSTEVSAEEGRRVPGTQGDVLKVVENLPGVARASIGSGQVVVWGAAPEDTRVYLDSVPLPRLYHEGGFRSVVNSDMVQGVELVPGGWGAEYGRGLGGLVNVQLKPPAPATEGNRTHGSVSADILDASADVRSRLSDRVSIELAGRKSYLDALLPAFTSRNVGEFIPIPRYYDAQARVMLDLSPRETFEIGWLLSSDAVNDTVPSDDPTSQQEQTHDASFERAWIRWKKRTEDGAELSIVPSIGHDSDRLVDVFGAVPTNLQVDSKMATLRATWRKRLAPWVTVTAGADAQVTSSRFSRTGSNTSPPRQGDEFVFGQAPSDQVAHDDGTTVSASAAPFVTADLALADGTVHVVPGVRVEPYLLTVNRKLPPAGTAPPVGLFHESTEIEPRLSVRWTPLPALTWKAGWGLYDQPPSPADLSSVFGDPSLGLESAEHLLGGVAVGTPDVVSFEVTAFRVTSRDLAVRNPLASPLVAEALVGTGVGRTRGIQFLLRKQAGKRFFGWITYTLSKSERADAPGEPYYAYDFDQTHVLGAVASYQLGAGFEVGGRFRYATGFPRTPVVGAYLDGKTGALEPLFGALNSIRIPPFWQLDVRVSKRFRIAGTELEAYLDLQNVTDRSNPEEIVYSPDYSQRRSITGLPILPVLGARWSW
ncbi:MAG TPA: TonB-dependent receptor [Polyangiaceae bacterium]|nr:TonB-dependent receptor [Polyangiaceae bacterium]